MTDPRDPFEPPDKTVLRPRPAGGARPAAGTTSASSPAGGTRANAGAVPNVAPPPLSVPVQAFIAEGRNPLLAAAAPLLVLGSRMQTLVAQEDVTALQRRAQLEVKHFEENAQRAGVPPDDVRVARYILCTFVDTAVYRTPWGAESRWSSEPLLVLFHHEASGGEKFFEILERIEQDPRRYLDLLELQYVCLALGYEGKYRNDRGQLLALQERLLQGIRRQRGGTASAGAALSPHWQGVTDSRPRLVKLVPWWIVGLAGLVLATGTWIALRHQLSVAATPVLETLANTGIDVSYTPAPPTAPGRLKPLLAAAERAGEVTVEEFGPRSLITLQGSDLFRSGSATLNPDYRGVIEHIAEAAERVPGRLVVVGHTDDQPVRSLRYQDNFELSRERAVAVAQLLREGLSDPARVEWTGLGATEPRHTPPSTPENRARNRRVEIVHEASGVQP